MTATTTIPACVTVSPGWFDADKADALFETLTPAIPWEQQSARMYGREVATPLTRLTAWFGDAAYVYSGTVNPPHAWLPELEDLRARLEAETGARFNSCLANQYRDGCGGFHPRCRRDRRAMSELLTTGQVAELAGVKITGVGRLLRGALVRLYDAAQVRAALQARPGRWPLGAHGGGAR